MFETAGAPVPADRSAPPSTRAADAAPAGGESGIPAGIPGSRRARNCPVMRACASSHAARSAAYAEKLAARMAREQVIVVNLSGRGDKDMQTVAQIDGIQL
jgi:hypothetical protein